jgi:hypothetical protein
MTNGLAYFDRGLVMKKEMSSQQRLQLCLRTEYQMKITSGKIDDEAASRNQLYNTFLVSNSHP